jgi:hypothetical protein
MDDQRFDHDYIAFRTKTDLFIDEGRELFSDLREEMTQRQLLQQRVVTVETTVTDHGNKLRAHDRFIIGASAVAGAAMFLAKVLPWLSSLLR